ncbi:hypothetical protein BVX95_00525, partial [archaeon D22]
ALAAPVDPKIVQTDDSNMTSTSGATGGWNNRGASAYNNTVSSGAGNSSSVELKTKDLPNLASKFDFAGGYHSCILLTNGNVNCYGQSTYAQNADYTGGNAVGVATGLYHNCILLSNGNVDCYGDNGNGKATDYSGGDAIGVAAGNGHTCFLLSTGNVDCQGDNGNGKSTDYAGGDAIGIALGSGHTCILLNNGNVNCQGDFAAGQRISYNNGDAIGVAAGNEHTCILLNNGNVDCYGSNSHGQSNDYTGGNAIGVSTGKQQTCILLNNGNVDCYGSNSFGQGADYNGGNAVGIASGEFHNCVLLSNGNVNCYGRNTDGQSADYNGGNTKFPTIDYYSYGTYTSFFDAGLNQSAWYKFEVSGAFPSDSDISFKIRSSASNNTPPDFSTGSCGSFLLNDNDDMVFSDTCKNSSHRYLWYEATLGASSDLANTPSLNELGLITAYENEGNYTSDIIDLKYPAKLINISFRQDVAGGFLGVKIRGSINETFSQSWNICDYVTSGSNPISGNCVQNFDRYYQYYVYINTSDLSVTSKFYNLTLEYAIAGTNSTGAFYYNFSPGNTLGINNFFIYTDDDKDVHGEYAANIEIRAPTLINFTTTDNKGENNTVVDIDDGLVNITAYYWRTDVVGLLPGEINISVNGVLNKSCSGVTDCTTTLDPLALGIGQHAILLVAQNRSAYYNYASHSFTFIVDNITTTIDNNLSDTVTSIGPGTDGSNDVEVGDEVTINGTATSDSQNISYVNVSIGGNFCGQDFNSGTINNFIWSVICTIDLNWADLLGINEIVAEFYDSLNNLYGNQTDNITIWAPTLTNYTFEYIGNYVDIVDPDFTVTSYYYRTDKNELIPGKLNISFNGDDRVCHSTECTETFDNPGLGNFRLDFKATNYSEYYSGATNYLDFIVATTNISVNVDVDIKDPLEQISIFGNAYLSNSSFLENVQGRNVSIYFDGVFQTYALTDAFGDYNVTIPSSITAGVHELKVNITDSHDIYGENFINFSVRIPHSSESSIGKTTGNMHVNPDEIINFSVFLNQSNIGTPIDSVWAKVTKDFQILNVNSSKDTFIDSTLDDDKGSENYLRVDEDKEALLYFDISAIDGEDIIEEATLKLYAYEPSSSSNSIDLFFHSLDSDWVEGVNYSTKPSNGFFDHFENFDLTPIPLVVSFNITRIVRDWHENGNYGLIISTNSSEYIRFASREWALQTPKLEVKYSTPVILNLGGNSSGGYWNTTYSTSTLGNYRVKFYSNLTDSTNELITVPSYFNVETVNLTLNLDKTYVSRLDNITVSGKAELSNGSVLEPVVGRNVFVYLNNILNTTLVTNASGEFETDIFMGTQGEYNVTINITDVNGIIGKNVDVFQVFADTYINYTYNYYYSPASTINITAYYFMNFSNEALNGTFNITIDNVTKYCNNAHECNLKFYVPGDVEAGNYTINISAENSGMNYETAYNNFDHYLQRSKAILDFDTSNVLLANYLDNPYSELYTINVINDYYADIFDITVVNSYMPTGFFSNITFVNTTCDNLSVSETCQVMFNFSVKGGLGVQTDSPRFTLNYTNNDGSFVSVENPITVDTGGNADFGISGNTAIINDSFGTLKTVLLNITNEGNVPLKDIELTTSSPLLVLSQYQYPGSRQYEEWSGGWVPYTVWQSPGWNSLIEDDGKFLTLNISLMLTNYTPRTFVEQVNVTAIAEDDATYDLNKTLIFNITIDVRPNITLTADSFETNQDFSKSTVFATNVSMNGNSPLTNITISKLNGDVPTGWVSYSSPGLATNKWNELFESTLTPLNISIFIDDYSEHVYTSDFILTSNEGLNDTFQLTINVSPSFYLENNSINLTTDISSTHYYHNNLTIDGNTPLTNITFTLINNNFSSSWLEYNSLDLVSDKWDRINESTTTYFNISVNVDNFTRGYYFGEAVLTTDQDKNQTINISITIDPKLSVTNDLSTSMLHNTSKTLSYNISSVGNAKVQDISISYITETLPASWISLNTSFISELIESETDPLNLTISVPPHQSPDIYTGYLNITSLNEVDKRINITVVVNESNTWNYISTFVPINFSISELGLVGNITIFNTGNIPLNFTIKMTDGGGFTDCETVGEGGTCVDYTPETKFGNNVFDSNEGFRSMKLDLAKNESKVFSINHDVNDGSPYNDVRILINMSANGTFDTALMSFTVLDQPPEFSSLNITDPFEIYMNQIISVDIYDDVNVTEESVYLNLTMPNGTNVTLTPNSSSDFGLPQGDLDTYYWNISNIDQEGVYTFVISATDYDNQLPTNNKTSYYSGNFTSVGQTTLSTNYTLYKDVNGVSKTNSVTVSIPVNITNVGLVNAYNVNLSGVGFPVDDVIIPTLSGDGLYNLNITVPASTTAGIYSLMPTLEFMNPNLSIVSINLTNITINVTPTHNFTLDIPSSQVIGHNQNNTLSLVVNTSGNLDESFNLSVVSDSLLNITLSESSFTILQDSSNTVLMDVSVANGASPATRNFTVNVTNGYSASSFTINITTPINDSYLITPNNLSIVGISAVPNVNTDVRIVSLANVNLTFNISLDGNLTGFTNLTNSNIVLEPVQNVTVGLNYTSGYDNNIYFANLSINDTVIPVHFKNNYFNLDIHSVSGPASLLYGDTIVVNSSIDFDGSSITENLTNIVFVGGQECAFNSEILVGNNTLYNCTVPVLADGRTYDVIVKTNYTDGVTLFSGIIELDEINLNDSKVYYKDITNPIVNSLVSSDSNLSSNVVIIANITDNTVIDTAYVLIRDENNVTINTSTLTNISEIYQTSFNIATPGYYNIKLIVNDTTGNVNDTEVSTFQVFDYKRFTGSVWSPAYRKSPGIITFNFSKGINSSYFESDPSYNYDKTLKTDYYDIFIRIDKVNSTINITNADFNTQPEDFIDIYTFTNNDRAGTIKGFAVKSDIPAGAKINTIFVDDDINKIVDEFWTAEAGHVRMYQCSNWDYDDALCIDEWIQISENTEAIGGVYISEGTTDSFCDGYCAFRLTMQPEATGYLSVLNDSLDVLTDHDDIFNLSFDIKNTGSGDAEQTKIYCSGDACEFDFTNKSLGTIISEQTITVNAPFTIPEYTENGSYFGVFNISYSQGFKIKNFTINVNPDVNYSYQKTITENVGGSSEFVLENYSVDNVGNVRLRLNVSSESLLILTPNPLLRINESANVSVGVNVPHKIGVYDYNFTIDGSLVNLTLNVTHEVNLVSSNVDLVGDFLNKGRNLTIVTNATYINYTNLDASWNISFGNTSCDNLTFSNNLIYCKVPTVTGSIKQEMKLSGTFNGSTAYYYQNVTFIDQVEPSILGMDKEKNINSSFINIEYYDDSDLDLVKIKLANSTKEFATIIINDSTIVANLSNLSVGDYWLDLELEDEGGYVTLQTKEVEVYQPVTFEGDVSDNAGTLDEVGNLNFTFKKPGREVVVHKISLNTTTYSISDFHNRSYDVKIEAEDLELELSNVSMTNYSDCFDIGRIDLQKADKIIIENPVGRANDLWGIYVNTNFNFSSGLVKMIYDINDYNEKISTNYLHILKCVDFDPVNVECNGDFIDLGTVNPPSNAGTKRIVEFNVSGFSAYVLSEFEPTPVTLPQNIGQVSGGGGGGGGGFKDGISEDLFNETISKYFSKKEPVKLDITEISRDIFVGETLRGGFKIGNEFNETVTFSVLTSGDISSFMSFEKNKITLDPDQSDNLVYEIGVSQLTKPGTYTGDILLRSDYYEKKIPVSLRIDEVKEQKLTLELNPESKIIIPGRELNADINLYNPAGHDLNMTLLVELYDSLGQKVIYEHESNFMLDDYFTKEITFNLSKDLRVDNNYILRAVASYNVAHQKFDVRGFENMQVQYPFVLREFMGYKIWKLLIGSLLVIVLTACLMLFKLYVDKRKRYHTQVEVSQLAKPGENSLLLGNLAESHMRNFIDMDKLMTHTIIAGSTGGGKSISAQVIAEEILEKNRSVIVFDPTAQWSGFLRALEDESLLKLYPEFDLSKKRARAFKGNIHIVKDARQKIDIVKYMKPGEIHVFTTNQLEPSEMDMFVASTVSQVFHANLEEARTLKTLIVYDEVHRLLPKFGGSGEGFLQIERACREFRKWGVGIMLISQVLSDFVGQIKANINTEIQVRTKDEGDLERIKMKYGDDFVRGILKADVGTGLLANAAYNRGRPYFTTFRPIYHSVSRLSDDELEKYAKYNERIETIEYWIKVLDDKKTDVFDFNLELNLAIKKLMVGGFNMVQIYLDGLEPRIRKTFEKLGIELPARKIELIEEHIIQKSIEAAKVEREKHIAEEKKKKEKTDDKGEAESAADVIEAVESLQKDEIVRTKEIKKLDVELEIPKSADKGKKTVAPIEVAVKSLKTKQKKSSKSKNQHSTKKDTQKKSKEVQMPDNDSARDEFSKLNDSLNEARELIDNLEKFNGSLRLERSRLNVLDKDVSLCEHGLGDTLKIKEKLESFINELKEDYK